MSISVKEIAWIAGLLEGEGYFGVSQERYPRIALAMTDLDIVEKARNLMDKTKVLSSHSEEGKSNRMVRYTLTITGTLAIEWMLTLYPLMGLRRRTKIRETLFIWKAVKSRKTSDKIPPEEKMIRGLMKFGLTREAAEKRLLESMISMKESEV